MLKMASPPPQELLCNLLGGLFMFLNTSTSAPCLSPPPPLPESVRWKSVSPRLVSASPSSHSEDITLSADPTVTLLLEMQCEFFLTDYIVDNWRLPLCVVVVYCCILLSWHAECWVCCLGGGVRPDWDADAWADQIWLNMKQGACIYCI